MAREIGKRPVFRERKLRSTAESPVVCHFLYDRLRFTRDFELFQVEGHSKQIALTFEQQVAVGRIAAVKRVVNYDFPLS